jgi:CRP/FNR family transcriptional regulator, cyclic AMP receptor protein
MLYRVNPANMVGRLTARDSRRSSRLRCRAGRKLDPESRTIAITQQEISEMVGMTRESINKQLGVWATRHWVRLEHGAIVVLDANSLRKLAETGSGSDE